MDLPVPMWWLEFDEKVRENRAIEEQAPSKELGGLSKAQWNAACKRHREKMNGK